MEILVNFSKDSGQIDVFDGNILEFYNWPFSRDIVTFQISK